jgi:hypothetical protein
VHNLIVGGPLRQMGVRCLTWSRISVGEVEEERIDRTNPAEERSQTGTNQAEISVEPQWHRLEPDKS